MSHKFQSSRSYYFQSMRLDQRIKPAMTMIRILGPRPPKMRLSIAGRIKRISAKLMRCSRSVGLAFGGLTGMVAALGIGRFVYMPLSAQRVTTAGMALPSDIPIFVSLRSFALLLQSEGCHVKRFCARSTDPSASGNPWGVEDEAIWLAGTMRFNKIKMALVVIASSSAVEASCFVTTTKHLPIIKFAYDHLSPVSRLVFSGFGNIRRRREYLEEFRSL